MLQVVSHNLSDLEKLPGGSTLTGLTISGPTKGCFPAISVQTDPLQFSASQATSLGTFVNLSFTVASYDLSVSLVLI